MAQAFPPLGQEFEPFLYSVLGEESNGMPLTMISALARSGADPWKEAARIARLPKSAAMELLARMIPDRSGAEAATIAKSLVLLLPASRPSQNIPLVGVKIAAPRWNPLILVIVALLFGLAVVSVFATGPHGAGEPTQPPAVEKSSAP